MIGRARGAALLLVMWLVLLLSALVAGYALSARIDASERESAVNSLARRFGITSDDDVALLRSVADPAQREALAVRLKPTDPSIPPDPGQGPRPTAPQSAQDAEYATFFPPERK